MKILVIIALALISSSCASLMKGQDQPIQLMDDRTKTYKTTCNGVAETIGSCHNKAKEICTSGYKIVNEKIDSTGIFREIVFQCK
jgi:hypothetical protein